MDIGKRIRDLREERGLTQREVARRAGLTPSGVGFIEHGQTRNPSAETVMAVARALGVPVEELLREPVPLNEASEVAGPKVVTGSVNIKVDRETFAILATVLTGEINEVIDGLADGELSREEAKEEAKERLERVLEPAL
jgi:transcriptional regulator with XRE-family HTH domain